MNRSARFIATSEAALATQIVLQLVCGSLLAFWYKATPAAAHAASESIRATAFPHLVAGAHFWGGQILMIHSLVHVAAMVWSGAYRDAWVARWYLAIGVCLCSFALMVTGNLLPFDRHGVQSAVTEIGIGNRVPLFGPIVADAMARGPRFGADTLAAWFTVHRWLLPVGLIALFAYSYVFRVYQEAARKNLLGMCLPAALAIVLGIAVRAPLGPAATPDDYGRFDALVNWYAWPLHGSLRAFDAVSPDLGWIGSAIMPLLIVGFLIALPRICEKVTPMFVQAVFVLIIGVLFVLGLCFGGMPAPILDRGYMADVPLQTTQTVSGAIDPVLALNGRTIYGQVGCVGCHGADARGGRIGPALNKIGDEHPDAAWFKVWIRDPGKVKPGSTMPAFPRLNEDQLSALA